MVTHEEIAADVMGIVRFSEQTGHPLGLNRPPSRSKSATLN